MLRFVFSFKNFLCLFCLCISWVSYTAAQEDDSHSRHKGAVSKFVSTTSKSTSSASSWKCEKLWANEAQFLLFMGEISTKHLVGQTKLPVLERLSLKSKHPQSLSTILLPSSRKPDSRVLFTDMDAMYDIFSYSPDYEKRLIGTKVKEENPVLNLYVKPLLTGSEDILRRRLEGLIDSVVNSHIRTRVVKEVNLYCSYPFYNTEAGLREFHYFFKLMGLIPSHLSSSSQADYVLPQAETVEIPQYKLNLIMDFPDHKKGFDLPSYFSTFNESFLKGKAFFQAIPYESMFSEFETKQRVLSQAGKYFWAQLRNWDESLEKSSYPGPDQLDIKKNPNGMRIVFSIPFPFENTSIPLDPILPKILGSKK